MFFCMQSYAQQKNIYYSDVTEKSEDKFINFSSTQELASDLAYLLSLSTKTSFKISPFNNQTSGIFLLLDKNAVLPLNESADLLISENKIIIRAKYLTGLSYGIYSFLNELGYEFYLPGNDWIKIPESLQFSTLTPKIYKPQFNIRLAGSSGRLLTVKNLDSNSNNLNEWKLWLRRNRMGSEFMGIDGHEGEKFNLKNKALLISDSMLLAPVNGKRKFSVDAKIDPSNQKSVELFEEYILQNSIKKKLNYFPVQKYVSADMGDGGNYCNTPACKKLFRGPSEQSFYILNKIAPNLKNGISISTLAYAERADTPNIKIDTNIHVVVVPFAYQKITTPADLLYRWSLKTPNFSLYEYVNIDVWKYGMPFYNLHDKLKFLNFAKTIKSKGVVCETSFSKFGGGVPQFFILKYLNSPFVNADSAINKFCTDMFGDASPYLKQIFAEWYNSDAHLNTLNDHPSFCPDELARFIYLLNKSEKTTGLNLIQRARIQELKAYVIYLCKYYEYFNEALFKNESTAVKGQKFNELIYFTWNLYDKMIFQNTTLSDLLQKATGFKSEIKDFSVFNKPKDSLINSEWARIEQQYLTLYFQNIPEVNFSIISPTSDTINIKSADEIAMPDFIYDVPFYAPKAGTLEVDLKINTAQDSGSVMVSVENENYWFRDIRFLNSSGKTVFNIPQSGFYKLFLGRFNGRETAYSIYTKNNIFYLNKKILPSRGINFFTSKTKISFLVPDNDVFQIIGNKGGMKLTSSFFYKSEEEIKPIINNFPAITSFKIKDKSHLIYLKNSQFRWPPVILNSPPYFFFLK